MIKESVLHTDVKSHIQKAYSNLLESRQWKARYSQRLMIAEIAKSIAAVDMDESGLRTSEPNCCVVEAGTGTGKTLAYTLATLPLAKHLGKKVVIATATVALQEQILYKDLPDIQRHSGLEFKFALAKGRRRYVCLAKLDKELQETKSNPFLELYPDEQAEQLEYVSQQALSEAMLDALSRGEWNGDRECWSDSLEDEEWLPLTADRNQCTGRHCSFVSQCSFFKARENLEQVDCIIANHDLVLADLSLGGGAILSAPEDTIYIFDEGHHLSQKALQHFSHHLRLQTSMQWLEQLQQLPNVIEKTMGDFKQYCPSDKNLLVLTSEMAVNFKHVMTLLEPYIEEAHYDEYNDQQSHRFANGHVPAELKVISQQLVAQCNHLHAILDTLQKALEENTDGVEKSTWDDCWNLLAQYLARVEQQQSLWAAYVRTDSKVVWARWLEILKYNDNYDFILHASPILAQDILHEYLWKDSFAVIVSSATLSALGTFARLQEQLGLPQSTSFHRLQSPFDFEKVTLNIPDMPCEPQNNQLHTQFMIDNLPEMLSRWQGNLVLFSSRRQMRNVYEGLSDDMREQIITQDDYSKIEVVRQHRKAIDNGDSSTIFGLASFAEGIDLPGVYCQHVIIAKIPFSVPGSPIEETLSEWLKQQGKNPFMEIAVPDAAQALIQACGRLLRSEKDEGEITLLDKRIVTKRYGQAILDALPPYKRNFY